MKNINLASRVIVAFMILGLTGTALAQHKAHGQESPLTEPGNDIFGAIQEVVQTLEADPNTNWAEVDIEALRRHLLDMKAFTEEVTILSRKPIASGTEIRVQPESARAAEALKRLFHMHPAMLKKEMGWNMVAKRNGKHWLVTCTTDNESEVKKIRALGYIGLLAAGAHHQRHHLMIATGKMKME